MKNSTIKILGIDPGINHTGWNIGVYNTNTGKLNIPIYNKFQANTIAKKDKKHDFKVYGNIVSLHLYEEEFDNIINTHGPMFVACEDAFYNPRMPNAFLSLKLCIHTIQRVLKKHNMILHRIPPTVAKQAVWGKGTASKEAVQESIINLENVTIRNTKQNPIEKMTEHEADSIAITYTFVKNILPNILLQMNKKK